MQVCRHVSSTAMAVLLLCFARCVDVNRSRRVHRSCRLLQTSCSESESELLNRIPAMCRYFAVRVDCEDHSRLIPCVCSGARHLNPTTTSMQQQPLFILAPGIAQSRPHQQQQTFEDSDNGCLLKTDLFFSPSLAEQKPHQQQQTFQDGDTDSGDNVNDDECFKIKTNQLHTNFSSWKFPTDLRLLTTFPIDPITDNFVRQVRKAVFSVVQPSPFTLRPVVAAVSENVLTELLDLAPSVASSKEFLDLVSGDLTGSRSGSRSRLSVVPLAHRYGGHQFGYWAGQLGDGRAVLLGEYVNRRGERWELQLKGSGRTPYSRQGDGRAVVRSSIREFLCSEAMHYLGIPTTRAASLAMSEDTVIRDQFYDGRLRAERTAVVLRLAPSWFRIGSLEILAHDEEVELLRRVVDDVLRQHFPEIDPSQPGAYLAFFQQVVLNTARLLALWQSVGFAHGVLNTDNFSLLSLTMDYGPFGFLDAYDPSFVPNTSDDEGRYSYRNQPDTALFNLEKLRQALLPLWPREGQRADSVAVLRGFPDTYKAHFMELFRKKLGLEDKRNLSDNREDDNDDDNDDNDNNDNNYNDNKDDDIDADIDNNDNNYNGNKDDDNDNNDNNIDNNDNKDDDDNHDDDEQLVALLLKMMEETKADFTLTFRHLGEATLHQLKEGNFDDALWALKVLESHTWFSPWVTMYEARLERDGGGRTEAQRQSLMNAVNPRYILRNWAAQLAVEGVEKGDSSVLRRLQDVLRRPFTFQSEAEALGLADPPPHWAAKLRVSCSS